MKLNRKIVVSFIMVFVILCGGLTVNAETLKINTDKESQNNLIFLEDDNTFTFDIIMDDPDFLAQGFSGILQWDKNAIVIDDVYSASPRRWTVLFNDEEGIFNVAKQKDGYVASEAVVTVEGHAIAEGDLTTVVKVNDLKFADRRLDPVDSTDYTDNEVKVTVRRIVLTPTEPDYHDNPTPEVSITPVVIPTEEPSATPTEGVSEVPSDVPSEAPSGSAKDDEDGKNNGNNGKTNEQPSATPTPDKTQKPTDKLSQAGTGKAVAIIMGAGIFASAVFYIKFSKNNY